MLLVIFQIIAIGIGILCYYGTKYEHCDEFDFSEEYIPDRLVIENRTPFSSREHMDLKLL